MYTAEDIRTAVRRQKKSWVSDWCDCFRFQIPYETQEGVPQSYSMEIGIEAVYSALGIPEQTWKKQDWKNPMVQRKLVTPFRETRMYQEICQDIAADMNRNGWIIREQEPKRKSKKFREYLFGSAPADQSSRKLWHRACSGKPGTISMRCVSKLVCLTKD